MTTSRVLTSLAPFVLLASVLVAAAPADEPPKRSATGTACINAIAAMTCHAAESRDAARMVGRTGRTPTTYWSSRLGRSASQIMAVTMNVISAA